MISNFKDKTPEISEGVYISDNAAVIGDVRVSKDASIWFSATLRGDEGKITIGEASNVQDNACIHSNTTLGRGVTVGHNAILHGCEIGDNTLIGMGAIVLDGAVVGENCIIGAGALVTGRTVIPAGSLVLGSPAKVKREITPDEISANAHNAEEYVSLAKAYLK